MNLLYHNLYPTNEKIEEALQNPSLVGLTDADLSWMNESQRRLKIIGEYYYMIWKQLGYEAGEMLMMAHWGGTVKPNWFDHRMHILQPDNYVDYWTISSDLVMRSLPLGGSLLSLCSGDGFYEGSFYRKRAARVTAIDCNKDAMCNARRLYPFDNIEWIESDIFDAKIPEGGFDVVCIRGAIEHFSQQNQVKIFKLAKLALKPGGYFVGDTPANTAPEKLHTDHQNEWANESEMCDMLSSVFEKIETSTFKSKDRTTLLWKCQK